MSERGAEKILIADDDASIRRLMQAILEAEGFQLLQATDGLEALEIARTEVPDLVVLDVMMPRLNGLEVLSKLKNDPRLERIRVLVVTAQPASEAEAREHGADGVIVKPFAPEDLADLAATLVSVT
jgi:CheY-like chemotaxis protein